MVLCDTGVATASLPPQHLTEYRCGCEHREAGPSRVDPYEDPEDQFLRRWARANRPSLLKRLRQRLTGGPPLPPAPPGVDPRVWLEMLGGNVELKPKAGA